MIISKKKVNFKTVKMVAWVIFAKVGSIISTDEVPYSLDTFSNGISFKITGINIDLIYNLLWIW